VVEIQVLLAMRSSSLLLREKVLQGKAQRYTAMNDEHEKSAPAAPAQAGATAEEIAEQYWQSHYIRGDAGSHQAWIQEVSAAIRDFSARQSERVLQNGEHIIYGFYEEEYPIYCGKSEAMELCSPVTPEEVNTLVEKWKAAELRLQEMAKALQDWREFLVTMFSPVAIVDVKEVIRKIDEVRSLRHRAG
jgi:hypothetical protein